MRVIKAQVKNLYNHVMYTEHIFAYKRLNYIDFRYLHTCVLHYQSCRYPMKNFESRTGLVLCVSFNNYILIYIFADRSELTPYITHYFKDYLFFTLNSHTPVCEIDNSISCLAFKVVLDVRFALKSWKEYLLLFTYIITLGKYVTFPLITKFKTNKHLSYLSVNRIPT